jgi:hypothetical protein
MFVANDPLNVVYVYLSAGRIAVCLQKKFKSSLSNKKMKINHHRFKTCLLLLCFSLALIAKSFARIF